MQILKLFICLTWMKCGIVSIYLNMLTDLKTGDIVLNTRPLVGSHIGWVCLDGIKWAGFGRID